jgi:hypothetical protein
LAGSTVLVNGVFAFPGYVVLAAAWLAMAFGGLGESRIIAEALGGLLIAVLGVPTVLAAALTRRLQKDAARISAGVVATTTVVAVLAWAIIMDQPIVEIGDGLPTTWRLLNYFLGILTAAFKDGREGPLLGTAMCAFIAAYLGTYLRIPARKRASADLGAG